MNFLSSCFGRKLLLKEFQNGYWINYCFLSRSLVRLDQYYLVINGRNPGFYNSWIDCDAQVNKFPKSRFKKFERKDAALDYLQGAIQENVMNLPDENIKILENILQKYKQKWNPSTSFPSLNDENNYDAIERKLQDSHSDQLRLANSKINEPFHFDPVGYLEIYTDGACSNNGHKYAIAGIGVYFGPNNPENISLVLEGVHTSTRAEIYAAIVALRRAKELGYKQVKILTDSQFLVNCCTRWMKKWIINDWKKANGAAVVNKKELIELQTVLEGLDVKWVSVRGHAGNEGNENADKLARSSIERWNEENKKLCLVL